MTKSKPKKHTNSTSAYIWQQVIVHNTAQNSWSQNLSSWPPHKHHNSHAVSLTDRRPRPFIMRSYVAYSDEDSPTPCSVTLNCGKRISFFMWITTGQSIFLVGCTRYLGGLGSVWLSSCQTHKQVTKHPHVCTEYNTHLSKALRYDMC